MMPHDHSNMLVELDSLCLIHKKMPPPPPPPSPLSSF